MWASSEHSSLGAERTPACGDTGERERRTKNRLKVRLCADRLYPKYTWPRSVVVTDLITSDLGKEFETVAWEARILYQSDWLKSWFLRL